MIGGGSAAIITAAGEDIVPLPSNAGFIVDGVTVAPGQAATVAGGQVVSLAGDESMLVVGTSTVAFAQTTEVGPGGAIYSAWVGGSEPGGSNAASGSGNGSAAGSTRFAVVTGEGSRSGGGEGWSWVVGLVASVVGGLLI